MYNKEFAEIYAEYNWDFFLNEVFKNLMIYFATNNISINNHLDIACGLGTLCNRFYENGINTEGIDLSPYMIDIAKNRYPNINFETLGMADFYLDKKYDLITCTGDSINHLLTVEEIKKACLNVYNHLEQDGLFIFDIFDTNQLVTDEQIIYEREDKIKIYYHLTSKNNKLNLNIIVTKDDIKTHEENVSELIINSTDLTNILRDVGFNIIRCSDNICNENQILDKKLYFICQKN